MLVYLSKKIAIPHNTHVRSLAWCASKGWIACGGENGLLKVLKLEHQLGADSKLCGLAAPSNLTMNQGLEAHHGSVEVVKWNEQHHKLTSSDQQGLIVVWMMYKGQWCEEMINNRNKSVVKDMAWSRDGQKICIVYEDGAVIVGSVDGNRMWGKDLKGTRLSHVQWSPNGKRLLFGTNRGEIMIHDAQGTYTGALPIHCLADVTGAVQLVGLDWYNGANGYIQPACPCLAIGFDNGRLQIMKNELDSDPVKIDTSVQVCCIAWNSNGSILAVGGSQQSATQDKEFNVVQFYTLFGEHLHTLRVPGKKLTSLAWEATSLRMALAVDSFIYFANVRHDYKWGYFANTVIYNFKKSDKDTNSLVFWNTTTGDKCVKSVKNLLLVTTGEDLSLLAVKSETADNEYALLLCNALGTPVAAKYIPWEPIAVSISVNHVLVASHTTVYIWQYRSAAHIDRMDVMLKMDKQGREGKEWAFHIDEAPSFYDKEHPESHIHKLSQPTWDSISAACVSKKYFVVGRISGTLQFYSLPGVTYITKFVINCRPQKMFFNCDSSLLAILDVGGIMSLYELSLADSFHLQKIGPDHKDVWDLLWASDDPELLVIMEKTRMYVIRGTEPEEPLQSSGHLCEFRDLQVKAVLVDEILLDPENPCQSYIINFEIKALRDTRDLLEHHTLQEACRFVEDNPHSQLWKLVCESALNQLDFTVAERCFVKCSDYVGIHFIKRIQKLDSESKQRAEVAAFFKRFEEAERIYLDMDRRDLAVDLRMKLGDWFRVVQLLKTGGGAGDDTLLSSAWNAIGDYYYERQKYQNALTYYSQGQHNSSLLDCLYVLEDFDRMQKLSESLPESHPLLQNIAEKFASFGMCPEASNAFVRAGRVDKAIEVCISLNHWDEALQLAKKNSMSNVPSMLAEYASSLLTKNRLFSAIAVYRKAGKYLEAAKLVFKTTSMFPKDMATPLRLKKIFVTGALLIEQYTASLMKAHGKSDKGGTSVSSHFDQMILVDSLTSSDTALIDSAWRGAEAYHFYILAQQQWYNGQVEFCLRTALMLRDYEDHISPKDIFSLIALASSACRHLDWCSKAFIKLEGIRSISDKERQQFQELALEIFTQHPPTKDSHSKTVDCFTCGSTLHEWETSCRSCGAKFPICIVSGKPLLEHQVWVCSSCKHRACEREIVSFSNCPLCHHPIDML